MDLLIVARQNVGDLLRGDIAEDFIVNDEDWTDPTNTQAANGDQAPFSVRRGFATADFELVL